VSSANRTANGISVATPARSSMVFSKARMPLYS
jgi:hypothetical protein